jgi:hypothetical protein
VTAALETLFAAVPVLRVPVVRHIIEWAARAFTDLVYEVADLLIDLTVIRIRNEKLRREFDRAAVELKIIAHQGGTDSQKYQEARDAFRKSFADFMRIRTSP